MNRQQAEQAFNESVRTAVHDHTHHPTQSALIDNALSTFGVRQEEPGSLGRQPHQADFVVVLASVRSAVLDLLEEAGVLK